MDDLGRSGRDRLSPDVENICPPFRGGQDDCRGVALALCRPSAPRRALARRPSCKGERLAVVRLALLAERILPGLRLLPGQRERRERGAAFLLLVPLRLRLLLFLAAAHLTFGHDVPPVLACPPARAVAGLKRRRCTDSSGVSLRRIPWSLASFAVRRHRGS